ncbi:MAG: nucleotidyltransferase domain-containing protein [Planctomycetota bacterium]|nr:nucleotidyltransferase domain-containing protein [Planctomycetota bacterium]
MFDLRSHTHLLTISGSRAQGLHTGESDVDLKGMAIEPAGYFHGLAGEFEQADDVESMAVFGPDLNGEEWGIAGRSKLEGSVYGIRKFMRLASAANPNVLEALFCRDEEVRILTPLGRRLREARGIFLSGQCAQTFSGYAANQLARIRLHYEWHNHGPKAAPSRADFDLPEASPLPNEELEAAESAIQKQIDRWEINLSGVEAAERIQIMDRIRRTLAEMGLASDEDIWEASARWIGLDDKLVQVMKRERGYRSARADWRSYQKWKANRNVARAALEAQHGYDTKHGAHLVRLLRMGLEIAKDGRCIVWRDGHDGEELRSIRGGAWSYERLLEWSAERTAELRQLKPEQLAVPPRPDHAAIDSLCIELVEQALSC